ncbi:MAG: trypsin-like peptidase domain-containing protein [Planctomycetaceae bacterium]
MRTTFVILMTLSLSQTAVAQVGKGNPLWKWTKPAKHHNAVVKVQIETRAERTAKALATGVVVHFDKAPELPKGEAYCLTAAHVIESAIEKAKSTDTAATQTAMQSTSVPVVRAALVKPTREIAVYYRTGQVSRNCKVISINDDLDVALLRVALPSGQSPVKLAQNEIKPGDLLEFAGLGGGSDVTKPRHFNAYASAPTTDNQIFADATLLPGDSGGAVFNGNQEVVGIISGGWIWWEGNIKNGGGHRVPATWPARACNLVPIRGLHRNRKMARRNARR